MYQLNEQVRVKTITGMASGVVVGRTLSNPAWYDIKTAKGVILNQEEKHVVKELESV
jgi:hypothetical protein